MQYPDFKLEVFFSKWEFQARLNMAASDIEALSLKALLAYASPQDRAHYEQLAFTYTDPWGSQALREQIAASYDHISPEQLLCFTGAQEGIYIAMHCLLEAQDHVITMAPNYQSVESLPAALCAIDVVPLLAQDNWRLDLEAIKSAIRPNTKLIIVNLPNNPTGALCSKQDYLALIALCRQHGIWLFCDEVYRGVEQDPRLRLDQAADLYERALSLNVLSKSYGLPGLRLGWIACQDRALLERMERMKHYTSICNPIICEILGVIALKARQQIWDHNRTQLALALDKMDRFFARFPDLFEWQRPQAASVCYPRYLGRDGVESFCQGLREQESLILLPASLYDSARCTLPDDRFRIGFGRFSVIDQGLRAIEAYIERNHNAIMPL